MVGIDVVDLDDPLLKSRHKSDFRFIAHPEDTYPPCDLSFWLLWTAKEAIFKVERKLLPFSPTDIQVNICQSIFNYRFTSGTITGDIFVEDEKVVAVAKANFSPAVLYEVLKSKTSDPSGEIREYIRHHFLKRTFIDTKVQPDTNGLPVMDYQSIPVSFSHHGRLMAFAYPEVCL